MATDPSFLGTSSSLSPWAGPYVTEMLGRGAAIADMPYQAYMGPLTAGPSALQSQAFQGLASLSAPTSMGSAAAGAGQVAQDMSSMSYTPTQFTTGSFTDSGTAQQGLGGGRAAYPQPTPSLPPIPYGDDQLIATTDMGMKEFLRQQEQEQPIATTDMGMKEFLRRQAPESGYLQPLPTSTPPQQSIMEQYMSPYLQGALEPQIAEAQRQAEIQRVQNAGRLSRAGAFGGGRQAIMESEGQRNLLRNLADITGRGYQTAFEQAQNLYGTEADRSLRAQQLSEQSRQFGAGYGLDALRGSLAARQAQGQLGQLGYQTQADVLNRQLTAGGTQRGIEQEGIAADIGQFEQERAYPYRQTQFMQSLLQGLPISTQQYQYAQPTGLESFAGGASGILSLLNNDVVKSILGLD